MAAYTYKNYVIEPRSYEVQEGPRNPAGWVPNVWLIEDLGRSMDFQPVSWPRFLPTKEEADKVALQMARQWIDAKG